MLAKTRASKPRRTNVLRDIAQIDEAHALALQRVEHAKADTPDRVASRSVWKARDSIRLGAVRRPVDSRRPSPRRGRSWNASGARTPAAVVVVPERAAEIDLKAASGFHDALPKTCRGRIQPPSPVPNRCSERACSPHPIPSMPVRRICRAGCRTAAEIVPPRLPARLVGKLAVVVPAPWMTRPAPGGTLALVEIPARSARIPASFGGAASPPAGEARGSSSVGADSRGRLWRRACCRPSLTLNLRPALRLRTTAALR